LEQVVNGTTDFDSLNTELVQRFPGTPALGAVPATSLHLYHAPNSICSQKVRATLAAVRQPYVSHLMDIFRGQTYDPSYVRLRATGCMQAGHRLADDHPGETSVASTGCDACVVPTLVYEDSAEILVDSRHICIEIDRRHSAASDRLLPDHLRRLIESELSIVDMLPNYQLLAVAIGKPSDDAPDNAFAASKVKRCDALIAEHREDDLLRSAYEAKRSKEGAAAAKLFGHEAMSRARHLILEALRALDDRLALSKSRFLFGKEITLADLFWGVELARIADLGLSNSWTGGALPHVDAYDQRLADLPAIRHAVTDWPGARIGKVATQRPF
jgi:2,5-dichlorohydroquinone reductive dechlorinase